MAAPTSNTALNITELDFFKIRDNLKTFLRSQDTFTDYDFEGSGLAILLDTLAYNTYYNSVYLNMAANESFLDTSQIRNNILSHAKAINYIPESPHGAQAIVNIVVTPSSSENQDDLVTTLDKYTKLIGQDIDGTNYTFVAINSNTSYKSAGSFTFANVILQQGEVITQQFEVSAGNRRFQLPSETIDTDTITISVQESTSNTYTTQYNQATDLTEITGDSPVFFVEEDDELKYSIYFGDGVIGKQPRNGNIIIATYLDTAGSKANKISKFLFTDPIGSSSFRDNVIITSVTSSYGGSDKEDIEKIRFRAPQFYTTQNRAVTVPDYESILAKDYSNIDAVAIWGGEDNDPPVYGKVYMSIKTKGYYVLSNLEKENIKNSLIENRNVMTIIPEIVDPDYVFLTIQGKVFYDPAKTTRTAEEIKTVVKQAILDYNDDELSRFKATFKKAKLQQYIEAADRSITGSDITIYLQKRIDITVNQSKNYTINFNTPLKKGDFIEKLFSFPSITMLDSANVLRKVFIEEVPNAFTGVDSIKLINPGINYETTPTVTITGDGTGATAVAIISANKINSIKVTNKGINYSRAVVTITSDTGSEAFAEAVLEARNGILRTFYYKDNGEKVIVNENIGIINYATGRIRLNSVSALDVSDNDYYDTDVLTVSAVPNSDLIVPVRNRILAIDENNYQAVQIEVIAES
jgi:hypothetical protein